MCDSYIPVHRRGVGRGYTTPPFFFLVYGIDIRGKKLPVGIVLCRCDSAYTLGDVSGDFALRRVASMKGCISLAGPSSKSISAYGI